LKEISYFTSERGKVFYLSSKVGLSEQIFILARELGFLELRLKARPQSSLVINLDSFDQLLSHFSASYFASSLLIPESEITSDLKRLFAEKDWNFPSLEKLLRKYTCSFENLFHRMTQILPKQFGLKHLFFLRYEYDLNLKKYEIARELHLSNPHGPHRVKGNEHYCSRWLIHRLTQQQHRMPSQLAAGIQRSRFNDTENEYLILSAAFNKPLYPRMITSVCIGLLANETLAKKIPWSSSPDIASYVVGETCERCSVLDCQERNAPLDPHLDPERFERIFKTLQSLN
jgi:predicted transcriptional regulator